MSEGVILLFYVRNLTCTNSFLFSLIAYPNISHGMDQAFKGHCDVESRSFSNQTKELVRRTTEALEKYSTDSCAHRVRTKPSRPIHEVASVITQHLKSDDQGGMLFKNMDPYQHGHITQDDFMHILSTKNTGLTRNEMKAVAKSLDRDRSGLLTYSNLYSSLEKIQSPPKAEKAVSMASNTNSYSQAFEESRRTEKKAQRFDEARSVSSAPVSSSRVPAHIEVAQPYQPYDGLQQYLSYQSKIESERREVEEKRTLNESKYGDAFDRVTLIEKPSNNFAPNTSVKVKDNVERYSRGSGNIPYYSTPASINDVVFNRFVVGRDGKKANEVFHTEDVIGTVAYDELGDVLSPKSGNNDNNNNDDASSYSRAYESLRSNVSHHNQTKRDEVSVKGHHNTSHHKSFVPLPTKKVKGAADPYERNFIGNPNTGRNRNSRAFHNSFIYDHRVPERLRRNEKRSNSAPPGKRYSSREESEEKKDARLESVGSLFRFLSETENNHNTVVPSPVRVSQKKMAATSGGEAERKNLADFACAPASPPKKKVMDDAKTVTKSMNTLVAQLNDHSKIKILNHKMKKIDVSNSGYVNKSEFSNALKEMGVKISPQQVTTLYEQNAKDNAGLDERKNTSLKLCTHQRGINVQDFIQKMRTRTSSKMLASRHQQEESSHKTIFPDENLQTPLEREDARVWKRVVETLSEERSGGKKIISDFFKDAQVNHNNEVPAEKLHSELNHIGSNINDVEFKNMLSNVKRKSNGNVDVDDFAREYHKRSVECRDIDKWMTLMPSLSSDPGVEAQGDKFKRVLKTQKKHFVKKQGAESAKDDPNYRTGDFRDRLNDPVVSATHSFEKSHVPACLTMSDTKEFRLERLKWSKLSNKFLNHKNTLLAAFGGEKGIDAPLSETAMKDKLYDAGVLLGNDDIKILQSYAITSNDGNKDLTFGKMCASMGLNLEKDNRRRMTLSSSADFESDTGIFSSATRSLLSNPSFQSTMLTTSANDIKLVKGNRKKRLDDETGLPMAGAPKNMNSASEFWEMKHVPEFKSLPAQKLSYHQRLGLPKSAFESTGVSINGSSGRGFTSLRQIKEERKRSSSAPPRYTTMSRNVEEQSSARSHVWNRESISQTQATAPDVAAAPSRFARPTLAHYINIRQQQRPAPGYDGNNAPLTTRDLQTSYSSSATEIDNQ